MPGALLTATIRLASSSVCLILFAIGLISGLDRILQRGMAGKNHIEIFLRRHMIVCEPLGIYIKRIHAVVAQLQCMLPDSDTTKGTSLIRARAGTRIRLVLTCLKMIAAVELQYAVAQKILIMRLNGIHFRAKQIVFGNLEFSRR